MKAVIKRILLGSLALLVLASVLSGCGTSPAPADPQPAAPEEPDPGTEEEPVDGGTTIRIDEEAPQEIMSDEITGFQVDLFLENCWHGDEEHAFAFRIGADEQGVLQAMEENTGAKAPADEELLHALQAIIRDYDLVKLNGLYEVTAGLPPECQERTLHVDYASGEQLEFTTNNEPAAAWAEEVYTVFADWFAEQGQEALYPDPELSTITRFRLEYLEDGLLTSCGAIKVLEEDAIDGERNLLNREIYDMEAEQSLEDAYILFPADYYTRLTEILAATDLVRNYDFSYYDPQARDYGHHDRGYYGMGDKAAGEEEEDREDLMVDLYIEYESGRRLNVETRKASEIEGLRPLLTELLAYHESLF